MGQGRGVGTSAALGGILLGTEVCVPLLMLCWICCWPDVEEDASASEEKGKPPRKPLITHERASTSGARRLRRPSEVLTRRGRFGSSACSLQLPIASSSPRKVPLSAHRSHEEIRSRRKSQMLTTEDETRYYSAPSVIDEVLHRRDWERSSKELHIPLKGDADIDDIIESIQLDETHADVNNENVNKDFKKHYTNVKSSKKDFIYNKELTRHDIKDNDATEKSNFYIGEDYSMILNDDKDKNDIIRNNDIMVKSEDFIDGKERKQSINESIRYKERPKLLPLEEHKERKAFNLFTDKIDRLEHADRSGAFHHSSESNTNMTTCVSRLGSVVPVSYEGGECYLPESGTLSAQHRKAIIPEMASTTNPSEILRLRHASDGDILAPVVRPESGAFSESDLDLDRPENQLLLLPADESSSVPAPAPVFHQLVQGSKTDGKETAI